MTTESFGEQLARVRGMAGDGGVCSTWDLSDNDRAALTAILTERDELRVALKEAVAIIRTWHGEPVWDIYSRCSPEMKRINEVLSRGVSA